jgi:hypothetical protein
MMLTLAVGDDEAICLAGDEADPVLVVELPQAATAMASPAAAAVMVKKRARSTMGVLSI